ncbi:SDR family NAD(P)-dependent oxidoreductase [Rhodoferax sediminis]|nr:glucose 1-dehydrogenase [Rhodoferax sediminis]
MQQQAGGGATRKFNETMFRLDSRVAIVTGAGGGIGGAIARVFANVGAVVACLDVDADRARSTAADIEAGGGRAIGVACDVGSELDTLSAVARVVADLGRPTVLVNVAAVMDRSGTVLDIDLQEWERVHRVNLTGAYLMSRAVLPSMIKVGGGSVIHTSSILGRIGRAGRVSYTSTKAALLQLGRTMALDHAAQGVRVNTLSPGTVETDRVAYRFKELSPLQREALVSRIPLKRFGQTEEIAMAALFLASDASSFVTGTDLLVDGGGYET